MIKVLKISYRALTGTYGHVLKIDDNGCHQVSRPLYGEVINLNKKLRKIVFGNNKAIFYENILNPYNGNIVYKSGVLVTLDKIKNLVSKDICYIKVMYL